MSTPAPSTIQLRCFVRIVDTGSFVEAGRELGLSTSAVSKTMTRLEDIAGVRLLHRSTHSLSLTPEGEGLIGPAREAVRRFDEVGSALAEAARKGGHGRVRLSAPTAFVGTCLAPLLPAFNALHPDIVLDLRGSDRMVDLAEDGTDIVLRTGEVTGIPGHKRLALCSTPWVAFASPNYLERRGRPHVVADLAAHDLVGFRNQRTGVVDAWRFGGGQSRHPETRWAPDAALILDDANAVSAAVQAGAGIAWAPRWLIARALEAGTVRLVLEPYAGAMSALSIIRRDNALSPPRVERVVVFLRQQADAFR